jgi:hypothetical protein
MEPMSGAAVCHYWTVRKLSRRVKSGRRKRISVGRAGAAAKKVSSADKPVVRRPRLTRQIPYPLRPLSSKCNAV